MSKILCFLYLSILVGENVVVNCIQEEIVHNIVKSVVNQDYNIFLRKLKTLTSENSKQNLKQHKKVDYQIFKNFLNVKDDSVIESTKVNVSNERRNIDYTGQSRRKREYPQLASNEEVEIDEITDMNFSEKERHDGFKRTTPKENPYAVLIAVSTDVSGRANLCSGTLLTSSWVLTAAHCFAQKRVTVIVYAGGNSLKELESHLPKGSQMREAKKFYKHPEYDRYSQRNDVAVVKVHKAFEMTSFVNTMQVAKMKWTQKYKACMMTGFGKVFYKTVDPEDYTRKTHYLEMTNTCPCMEGTPLEDIELCSRPREDYGLCSGDSGGGLVCNGVVVAVAFAIIEFENIDNCTVTKTKHCGIRNTLSIFQEVDPYLGWIKSKINRAETSHNSFAVLHILLVVLYTNCITELL